MIYDYLIVGSGPSGLTCASEIINNGMSCAIVDQYAESGGCHKVFRPGGRFAEHGPRIYSSAYRNFHSLLKRHGVKTKFKKYKYSIAPGPSGKKSAIGQAFSILSFREIIIIIFHYILSSIYPPYYKKMSCLDLFGNFSEESQDYIDRICRLTDGAGMDRYTAYQFLQLVNQNALYNIQEPALTNDEGWVKELISDLKKKGTVFIVDQAKGYEYKDENIILLTTKGKYECRNLILAIPPKESRYETYIPITLHWDSKIDLEDVWGQGVGPLNIAWIVMTDYFENEDGTIISCCISRVDSIHELDEEELKRKVFLQMKPFLGDVPDPDAIILSPDVIYKDGKWQNTDTAFMQTKDSPRFSYEIGRNVFSVGTHNGNSTYSFTTAESAVQNALSWSNKYLPVSTKKLHLFTVNQLLILVIILLKLIMI